MCVCVCVCVCWRVGELILIFALVLCTSSCLLFFLFFFLTKQETRDVLFLLQDNLQILRDLSLLQIQMRDLEGYRVRGQSCTVPSFEVFTVWYTSMATACRYSRLIFCRQWQKVQKALSTREVYSLWQNEVIMAKLPWRENSTSDSILASKRGWWWFFLCPCVVQVSRTFNPWRACCFQYVKKIFF